jgi:hypothetical protein
MVVALWATGGQRHDGCVAVCHGDVVPIHSLTDASKPGHAAAVGAPRSSGAAVEE